MSMKQFKDLNIGDKFTFNNIEYVRISDERISCCQVKNAALANDSTTKIQVPPLSEVEVND
ncbi:hypothetical protein EB118_12450 [bacterium]|nr:hypothetical protein [bacterium]